jgi:hypothetical protein
MVAVMGLFDRSKGGKMPARRKPEDRWKSAGAREYEARLHERQAERLEAQGDLTGAQAERQLAADVRASHAQR